MDYGKSTLPLTGAGITIGGVLIDQLWLAVVAAVLIVVGAVLIRVGWRRGKKVSQP